VSYSKKETALLMTLFISLYKQRLPRLVSLKNKVNRGELLNEFDIIFLQKVHIELSRASPFADRHPEYQSVMVRLISLYESITHRALDNEVQRPDQK
jgi:hypothetical protein